MREGKKRILLYRGPERLRANHLGLGSLPPLNIIALPILFEGSVRAVVELASFSPVQRDPSDLPRPADRGASASCSTPSMPTPLTENLLKQSQSQAEELRLQQEELRESNEDLGRQANAARRAEHGGGEEERGDRAARSCLRRGEGWRAPRCRRGTSPSSSPTCPTSSERRSTAS